jgi:carboxylesterase
MWVGIIAFIIAFVLLIALFTNIFLNIEKDYRKLGNFTACKDLELINNNKRAVLLLHEFMGSPRSMEYLANRLFNKGYDCFCPALPGSSETEDGFRQLSRAGFEALESFVLDKYYELQMKYDRVFVIGASLGGTLALRIAQLHNPDAIIASGTSVSLFNGNFRKPIRNIQIALSGLISLFVGEIKTSKITPEAREMSGFYGVSGFLYPDVIHSHKIGYAKTRRGLKRIRCDVLLLHTETDRISDPSRARLVAKKIPKAELRIIALPDDKVSAHHLLISHKQVKSEVADIIIDFLQKFG